MSIHKDVEEAIDLIDCAVFGGDSFVDPDNRDALMRMLARWQRGLTALAEAHPNGATTWEIVCTEGDAVVAEAASEEEAEHELAYWSGQYEDTLYIREVTK